MTWIEASSTCSDQYPAAADRFMCMALEQAETALAQGEVPVGCVFVRGDTVIATSHNRTNAAKHALAHAELLGLAIIDKTESGGRFHCLTDVDLYVSIEPCLMCAAALLYRRIRCVFFGAANTHFGGNGSILNIHRDTLGCLGETYGYRSVGGLRQGETVALLQRFYCLENPLAPGEKRCRKEKRRRVAQNDATT